MKRYLIIYNEKFKQTDELTKHDYINVNEGCISVIDMENRKVLISAIFDTVDNKLDVVLGRHS
jgi:peptide deformylase